MAKKMAAVHFTTIPCEHNRAISTHRKPYFGEIHPCTDKIVYARFEVFRTFLCVFMSSFTIFVRYELWINVPVAIFYGTVDSLLVHPSCCVGQTFSSSARPAQSSPPFAGGGLVQVLVRFLLP